jgi:hypothetical protein
MVDDRRKMIDERREMIADNQTVRRQTPWSLPAIDNPQPSALKGLSNFRTLRTFGAKGSVNPHAKGVSKAAATTLGPQGPVKPKNLKNLQGGVLSTFLF